MARLTSLLSSLLLVVPFAAAAPLDLGDIGSGLSEIGNALGIPISNPDAKNIIPNRYIVVYNNTFGDDVINAKEASFINAVKKRNLNKRGLLGKLLSTEVNSFSMNKWRAMSLDADDAMIMDIYNSEEVSYIEADTKVSLNAAIAQTNAPPGLERLSHATAGTANYIFDNSAGEGITAYVVDTGIRTTHTEFEGRATFGANFINDVDDDENGHGSHVAGTIAGATFGVAKNANLIAVKVLDADGGGSNSGVLQGMQFVINDAQEKGITGKAVMNMSLGGEFSQAINRAIEALHTAGIVPVVAAGNEAVSDSLLVVLQPSKIHLTDTPCSKILPTPRPARPPTPSPLALSMPPPTSVLTFPTLVRVLTSTPLVSMSLASASDPTPTLPP